MNKKLEIGIYIRAEKHGIKRILDIGSYCGMNQYILDEEGTYTIDNSIIKSSHNLIDLIEVGDYVNGCLVLFAGAVTWDNDGNILDKRVHINRSGNDLWLSEKFIETVVTKEQFKSVEYEVK